jgi:outer membrane protein assembly factor BamB
MNGTMRLNDDAIRTALAPASAVHAPAGLADTIRESIDETPQRRAGLIGWVLSPRTRLAVQLVAVGLLLVALVLGALLVGSRSIGTPSVTTYHGGPERTGVMPGPGPSGTPAKTWVFEGPGSFGGWSPAVVDGSVYVGDQGGSVTAIDETTGRQRWQARLGAAINSGITISGKRLIVGDDAGVLHVLDATSGAEDWQYLADGPIHGSAAVVDDVAYFGSTAGSLYALELETRQPRWPAVQTPGSISRAIAVSEGVVYVGSGGRSAEDDGTLRAYDATTGRLLWLQPLEPGNTTTPTVADGRVFVAGGLDGSTAGHHVFAFDVRTGAPAWLSPFEAPSDRILLLGAVADGFLYATGTDGMLYVLDDAHGSLQWTAQIGSSTSPNAAIVDRTLYVTSDDRNVHAIDVADPAHGELWAVAVTGVPSAPVVINGGVFVTTSSGLVMRLGDSGSVDPTTLP